MRKRIAGLDAAAAAVVVVAGWLRRRRDVLCGWLPDLLAFADLFVPLSPSPSSLDVVCHCCHQSPSMTICQC